MITETRKYKIKDRIFTLADALALAKLLEAEAAKHPKATKEYAKPDCAYKAVCEDGTLFESPAHELFAPNSIITRKRVIQIALSYNYRDIDTPATEKISISVNQGSENSPVYNEIRVVGTDSNWVNGTMKSLAETVETFQPQIRPLVHRALPLQLLVMFFSGKIVLSFFAGGSRRLDSSNRIDQFLIDNPIADHAVSYAFYMFIGALIYQIPRTELIDRYWPKIELQIGPAHTLVERNKRNAFYATWTLAILPILIGLVPELVKLLANTAK